MKGALICECFCRSLWFVDAFPLVLQNREIPKTGTG